jgi:hypothetical protein
MGYFLLFLTIASLSSTIFFFYVHINLLYGSLLFLFTVLLSLGYASTSTVNKLPDNRKLDE